jgi:hypothetical protein
MNLGALFPNLGEPAPPVAAYPSAVTGNGFGGSWIWILIIVAIFFWLRRSGLGGLGTCGPTCGPGYGVPFGPGRGGLFGGY